MAYNPTLNLVVNRTPKKIIPPPPEVTDADITAITDAISALDAKVDILQTDVTALGAP